MKTNNLELVTWSCGCVGFLPAKGECHSLIVRPCDEGGFDLFWTSMDQKGFTPLTEEANTKILNDLRGLLIDGKKFREIKGLLA